MIPSPTVRASDDHQGSLRCYQSKVGRRAKECQSTILLARVKCIDQRPGCERVRLVACLALHDVGTLHSFPGWLAPGVEGLYFRVGRAEDRCLP